MKFVKNAWYVAGWADEFRDTLRSIRILDHNIVTFRSSNGSVVALDDRCPHKYLPLSKGQLVKDQIVCGYHGLTFDGKGYCTRVPGQSSIPSSAKVHAYPIDERHGIVWIWMGEIKKANKSEIFDLPQFNDPKWHPHQGGSLHLKCNYLSVAENLVDPAHVSWVHPTTLGSSASEDIPVQFDITGKNIIAWRWIRNSAPIGFFQQYGNFTGNVDRWHYYYLYLPSIAVIDFGSVDTELNIRENQRHEGCQIYALHFITPVSDNYTIDRWMHIRNTAVGDDGVSKKMDEMFKVAFDEDKVILEAVQTEEERETAPPTLRLAIDKGSHSYRKRINKLIEAEASNIAL